MRRDDESELAAEHAMAVIATLHVLNAAAMYADRVMLLKDGVAVGCGPPLEVLAEENLRRVYETDVYVGRNPETGALAILPAGPPAARRPGTDMQNTSTPSDRQADRRHIQGRLLGVKREA